MTHRDRGRILIVLMIIATLLAILAAWFWDVRVVGDGDMQTDIINTR